ncbi:hypothetical protein SteCoe_9524 [Stentor coeruleus]|uniref:Uncharacterized protein n=1 Tax=Stentor coeruleus TaxID=5963 RepID=A0A1R2CHM6_9CILI|nr:hypothetical protein SteCoe_9524 [Stentor coeruleus]
MEARLEALISAYNVKPKKGLKKKKQAKDKPSVIKQSTSMNSINLSPKRPKLIRKVDTKALRKQTHHSVQPSQRSESDLAHRSHEKLRHNTSLDEDLMKLETLTLRNSNARMDLISIQERMIQLGVKRNLNPILEIDEIYNEENPNFDSSVSLLMMRIKSKTRMKNIIRSLGTRENSGNSSEDLSKLIAG